MGYHFSVRTVRLDLGGRFNFFGADTSLAVVARPDLGAEERVLHQGTRTVLVHGVPLRAEPVSSVDVPSPAGGGWVTGEGAPASSWSYDVTVTATAAGRAPVVWRHVVAVPASSGVIQLNPSTGGQITASTLASSGATVDPFTGGVPGAGGGGGSSVTYAVEAVKGLAHLSLSQSQGVKKGTTGVALPGPVVDSNFAGQNVRLTFPTNYDWFTPLPLLIMFNGSGTLDVSPYSAYAQALADTGVLVAKSEFHGQHHGSPTAMADVQNLYEWALRTFPISGVILHGNSMGGIGVLNTLTTGAVPNILGAYITDPSVSLKHRYDNGRDAEIRAAYGIASDGSNYATKTAGHDPNLRAEADFRGVPIRIVASSGDTVVPLAEHGAKLKEKLGAQVDLWDVGTPGHSVADRFNATDLVTYIRKWAGDEAFPAKPSIVNTAFDFDAATLSTGAVTTWAPKAGALTAPLAPVNTAPTVELDPDLGVNVVRFPDANAGSSTPSHLATAAFSTAVAPPATVFMVVKDRMSSGAVTPAVRRYLGGAAWNEYMTMGATETNASTYVQPGTSAVVGPAMPGTWSIIAFTSNGASSWLRVNNTVKTFTANTDAAAKLSRLKVGANSVGNGQGTTGSVARVIGYNRALTAAEADGVFNTLAAEYGIV